MHLSSPAREKREGQYPLTYMIDARTRRDRDAIALSPLAVITAVSVLQVVGLTNNRLTPPMLLALGFSMGLYAFLLSRPTRRRVILDEDSITVSGWLSTRKLNRSEILGRKMIVSRYGSCYVIVPVDTSAKKLTLPMNLHVDREFFAWMKDIPHLH